ncbi:MAG: 16S rRNA (guanine(527)-N(7))-methyltransferase RsmG [Pseudomonadota bacterium]
MTRLSKTSATGLINVSRETEDDLTRYVRILEKWNSKINLISKSTLDDIWRRHIADSAQLWDRSEKRGHWVDLGSGGGFPGLVIAILAKKNPDLTVALVEADMRKATFLKAVVRELELPATVHSQRIEKIGPLNADILSARALAPLDALLQYADMHRKKDGMALFPKGQTVDREIRQALENWRFDCEKLPSIVEPASYVLKIGEIARA